MTSHRECLEALNWNMRNYDTGMQLRKPILPTNRGPLNIKGMNLAIAAMEERYDSLGKETLNFFAFLENMWRTGPMTIQTDKGFVIEQGSPGMHGNYTFASIASVVMHAPIDSAIFHIATKALARELYFYKHFLFGRSVLIPAPRIKRAKHQVPVDGYRDRIVAQFFSPWSETVQNLSKAQDIALWSIVALMSDAKLRTRLVLLRNQAEIIQNSGFFLACPIQTKRANSLIMARLDPPDTLIKNSMIQVCHALVASKQAGTINLAAFYDWKYNEADIYQQRGSRFRFQKTLAMSPDEVQYLEQADSVDRLTEIVFTDR